MENPSEACLAVFSLVEAHRRLANCERPFDRFVGTLCLDAELRIRLAQLDDVRIGQLLSGLVCDDLRVFSPEIAICEEAAERLCRSAGGRLAAEDIARAKRRTICPRCGNEMLLHRGIEEPDFFQCGLLTCQHKEYGVADRVQPSDTMEPRLFRRSGQAGTPRRARRSRRATRDEGEYLLNAEVALFRGGIPFLQLPWQKNRFTSTSLMVPSVPEAKACLCRAGFREKSRSATVLFDRPTGLPVQLIESKHKFSEGKS